MTHFHYFTCACATTICNTWQEGREKNPLFSARPYRFAIMFQPDAEKLGDPDYLLFINNPLKDYEVLF